jgi:hypothetical protein
MLDVQEKQVRVHDESTMGIRDYSRTGFSMVLICPEVNPTSEYVRSIHKESNMSIR